jgi:hypothetical protein
MITTLTGKPIRHIAYDLVAGETSTAIIVRVTPTPGDVLMSEQSDAVKLKAREHGSGDPYVDLADGIDLSDYTPSEPVDFDLVCEADESLTGLVRSALFLGVTTAKGAAWGA